MKAEENAYLVDSMRARSKCAPLPPSSRRPSPFASFNQAPQFRYGEQQTEISAELAVCYEDLKLTKFDTEDDRKACYEEQQKLILKILDREIALQECKAQIKPNWPHRPTPDVTMLSTLPASDVIERYSSANRREFLHLLDALQRLRGLLRTALAQVLESTKPLTDVALDGGFSSHSHFTDRFRHAFGETPSLLRTGLKPPWNQV